MVGNRLVAKARDPSPLVRCELVVALCGFIYMCEPMVVDQAYRFLEEILERAEQEAAPPEFIPGPVHQPPQQGGNLLEVHPVEHTRHMSTSESHLSFTDYCPPGV